MTIGIDQNEVELTSDDFEKCLVNQYFECATNLDNKTDYIVEVYKAARFFFLSAFTLVIILFAFKSFLISPNESAKVVARELLTDTNLLRSVRGERSDSGSSNDPRSKDTIRPKGKGSEKRESRKRVLQEKNQGIGKTNINIPFP
jgi:hypothetical protein